MKRKGRKAMQGKKKGMDDSGRDSFSDRLEHVTAIAVRLYILALAALFFFGGRGERPLPHAVEAEVLDIKIAEAETYEVGYLLTR